MKELEQIKECKRISVNMIGMDGGHGTIAMPTWTGSVIWSRGGGWEHVSVSPMKSRIVPSWDDMCLLKDIFFNNDEAVIQIHPPKGEYVNNMSNCLHLWRCYYTDMVLPPSCFVGIRKGQTPAELRKEIVKQAQHKHLTQRKMF